MKTGLITPCTNLIQSENGAVNYEELNNHFQHFLSEVEEVREAWECWKNKRDGKSACHLGEEFGDVATMVATLLEAMELLPELDCVPNFADHILLMDATKNFARGYHNKPMV